MHTILLTTDTEAHAKALADFLSNVKTVKSISVDPEVSKKYNWINPTRPATDEEFEQLAVEMEKDKGEHSPKEVVSFVTKELKAWRRKKK
jgi:hypothetical protein